MDVIDNTEDAVLSLQSKAKNIRDFFNILERQ